MHIPYYSDLFENDKNLSNKYFSLSKEICKKLKINEHIKYIDRGVYGFSFRVGKNNVFKFTKDQSEVAVALRNTFNNKNIINIFDVIKINTNLIDDENLYLIIENYIEKIPENKKEYIVCLIEQIYKNKLTNVDRFLSKNLSIDNKYLSDLKNIYYECKKLKIKNLDLHIDNLGFNSNEELVLFDLGNFENEKISKNVKMIKIDFLN